jgi:hypothetical protein
MPVEKPRKKVKKEGTNLHDLLTFEALTDIIEGALLKCARTLANILALGSLPSA